MSVYILATLDTKGVEAAFVRDRLVELGVSALLVDTGCNGEPAVAADVSRDEVFREAGTSLAEMRRRGDRGLAVTNAALGAMRVIQKLHAAGQVDGVLGLGGSAGTTIATSAMRALPLGVPKVMVSTLASGQVRPWVGDKDIWMLNSVVDILGINRISRIILGEAAAAMAGMVRGKSIAKPATSDRPLIAATMFGVTTPCVTRAREVLEAAGFEVLVFHATGNGGQAMESLIRDGLIAGVLDITTTELADELVGGILTAGPDRLTAAGLCGVPQVISVGALDMVNFGPPDTVLTEFNGRQFYRHNPTVTLMRTTSAENRQLGEEICRKAAVAKGPTCLMLPLQGVSAIDRTGQPFDDPGARTALFDAIREHHGSVELIEFDLHINDAAFAEASARKLIAMVRM
ncbi:MAG: Tm-1-like ATP-binding domain-containing protein [Planctomycetales bacterium]|nr:Tm-1-like ATP-binding domain-containing protein [Planctomycetales bacterium]